MGVTHDSVEVVAIEGVKEALESIDGNFAGHGKAPAGGELDAAWPDTPIYPDFEGLSTKWAVPFLDRFQHLPRTIGRAGPLPIDDTGHAPASRS